MDVIGSTKKGYCFHCKRDKAAGYSDFVVDEIKDAYQKNSKCFIGKCTACTKKMSVIGKKPVAEVVQPISEQKQ